MNYEDELKIYYLFTLIDGKSTEEENVKFRQLCYATEFGDYDHEKIIKECEEMLENCKSVDEYTILDKISEVVNWSDGFTGVFTNNCRFSKKDRQRIIWNLISLAYTDNEFSEIERKAIDLWAEKFKIPDEVYQEMFDTAQTMLDLTNLKEQLKSTSKPYNEINKQVKKVDQRIKELYESVGTLISLSYIESQTENL